MTTNHTPTPWRAIDGAIVPTDEHLFQRGSNVAFIANRCDAALIVRAVNAHDALVSIVERMGNCGIIGRDGEFHHEFLALLEESRAALALAKGTK